MGPQGVLARVASDAPVRTTPDESKTSAPRVVYDNDWHVDERDVDPGHQDTEAHEEPWIDLGHNQELCFKSSQFQGR